MLWDQDLEGHDLDPDDKAALIERATAMEIEGKVLLQATGKTMESNGQTAWLDAYGHGVGFWSEDYKHIEDRQIAEDLGDTLSRLARKHLGGLYPYLGDDGWVYVSGLGRKQ